MSVKMLNCIILSFFISTIFNNFIIHGMVMPKHDINAVNLRQKRFVRFSSLDPYKPNYEDCLAPGGLVGHCRPLHQCLVKDLRASFWKLAGFMCVTKLSTLGVCCPDEVQPEVQSNIEGSDLILDLPSTGDVDENVENRISTDGSAPIRGCGVSGTSTLSSPEGGKANFEEWPWMAVLLRGIDINFCGGVLITDRHVLTAAHCTNGLDPKLIKVRLGEYDFTLPNETRHRDFKIAEIRQHEDFDLATYLNDIAIIKLERPTVFNSYIWPICLPPVNETFENVTSVVAGWGTSFFGGPVSDVLMEVSMPVWSNERCQNAVAQLVPETTICAAAYEGGKDSCQGDSGGPLMHQLPNGRWVNIGVVSWGIKCGEPGQPGLYTRVNKYLKWIVDNCEF